MSIEYSDVTNKDGLLQFIEFTLGFPDGYITDNSTRKAQWTAILNVCLDRTLHTLYSADGKFQFDDANHSKNPFITFELTINQKNYNLTNDEQGNLILDIHAVYARQSTTSPYYLLEPRDMQSEGDTVFTDGITRLGWPTSYDKTGNLIKLDYTPSATVENGLKALINREGSYFATSDTTKEAGFAGLYHEVLILEACYRYARANNLVVKETLKRDIGEMKEELIEYQSRRARDERTVMSNEPIIYE